MNNQKIGQVFLIGVLSIFGIYVVASSLTGGGNALGSLAKYLAPTAFLLSFLNGRMGLRMLVVAMAFSDLIKRFLIEYGNFSMLDVTSILMICPMIMSAAFLHFLIARILAGRGKSKFNDTVLLVTLGISGLICVGIIARYGLGLGGLKEIAHQAAYVPLVWTTTVAFKNKEELFGYLRFTVFVFFLVALYGIRQYFFGFTQFEYDYLLSGFSSEAKHLKEKEIHAFSTMSSSVPFGITMGIMAGFTILLTYAKRESGRNATKFFVFCIVFVFLLAVFGSSKRSAWVIASVILILPWIFRSVFLTRVFYSVSIFSGLLLVIFVEKILKNWSYITYKSASFLPEQLALSTLSARLVSIYNWSRNPDMWTLFGVPDEVRDAAPPVAVQAGLNLDSLSSMLAHDVIGFTLLSFGAPILILLLVGVTLMLKKIHIIIRRSRYKIQRMNYAILMSIIGGAMLSGLNNAVIFPVNAFAYLSIGLFIRYFSLNREDLLNASIQEELASKNI